MAHDGLRFTRLGVIVLAALLALAGGMIPVQAAPSATTVGPFVWNVAFYNNANLSGAPVLTRQDTYVGGNWGTGSPAPGVNADNFSARWTTTASLTAGTYRLTFVADDAVRLYIDNKLLVNTWDAPQPGATVSVTVSAVTGSYMVQIDYREFSNTAYLYFTWEQLTSTPNAPTPAPSSTAAPVGTVNTAGLNVLSGPDYNFSLIEVAFQGWRVRLLERNGPGTWLKVRTPTTKVGWVEVSHITTSYPIADLPIGDRTGAAGSTAGSGTTYGPPPYTPPTTYPPGTRTYVVQPGDNLFRISLRFGVDMYTLARVNGIINLNLIYVGQVLIIP